MQSKYASNEMKNIISDNIFCSLLEDKDFKRMQEKIQNKIFAAN